MAANPKLTQEEWSNVRTAWETDTRKGFQWLIEDLVEVTTTTKEVPPDTGAAFIWLKNRRSQNWRDKHEVTVKHKIDKEMMDRISTEMVERLAKAMERQKQVLIERGITDERY